MGTESAPIADWVIVTLITITQIIIVSMFWRKSVGSTAGFDRRDLLRRMGVLWLEG